MPTSSTRSASSRRKSAEPRLRAAVQWVCRARGAPPAARLRSFARAATRGTVEVTLRIVGTAEGRRLNRDYRRRDYATNVLTFGYGRSGARLRGDIVLCHPVVVHEARAQRKSTEAHYAHLVVHAMLHLRGYDHRRAQEARRMERAEARALRRLGFADPYRDAGAATVE